MNAVKLTQKKIIIVGCPGSGKSYFARQLRDLTGIPICYMDCVFWKENWEHIPREELRARIDQVMDGDAWIIDGNYEKTMEDRFARAELVFFLDMAEELCIDSEAQRRGTKREDLPEYLDEGYDPEFVEFIRNYKNSGRLKVLELIEKYPEKQVIIFRTREEKEEYLELQKSLFTNEE